ncbi:zonular occludens toxin domain-containing protein [Lysinibacillus sp. CTST325]
MSIELYTGFVGSGKSYAAVKNGTVIADAPMGKRWVIANFPIKPKKKIFAKFRKEKFKEPRWIYKENEELTPDYLIKKSIEMGWNEKEGSCLVIFDEAGIPFNARSWNKSDRMEWIKFLSQSRKFGYDFIFITQHRDMMDKQIRNLCEYEVQHKRLNNMHVFKILSLFRVTLFAGISFWNGMSKERGTLRMYFYKKKVADRYDTLRIFDRSDEDVQAD